MKTWISTEIFTNEQRIRVQPTDSCNGITLEFKDSHDTLWGHCLYLDKQEMNDLIKVMQQMMEHVEEAK